MKIPPLLESSSFRMNVFGSESRINQHNFHYYAVENPQLRVCHGGKTGTLTVWACIFPATQWKVNDIVKYWERKLYQHSLEIDSVGFSMTELRQYGSDSRTFLDDSLEDRWIGRRGPIKWPPSTVLTPWLLVLVIPKEPSIQPSRVTSFLTWQIQKKKIEQEISKIPLDMHRRAMNQRFKKAIRRMHTGWWKFICTVNRVLSCIKYDNSKTVMLAFLLLVNLGDKNSKHQNFNKIG